MKDRSSLWILTLIAICFLMKFNYGKEIKQNDIQMIDKAFNKQELKIAKDDDPGTCYQLFNKMNNTVFNECFKKDDNHFYVFHILSKLERVYYEFLYGVCLPLNDTTINQYVNEDYLMTDTSIQNSQIVKRKELYQAKNFQIASLCVICLIIFYILFSFILWIFPCQVAIIDKNDSLLKQEITPQKVLNGSVKISEKDEEIEAKLKQKQLLEHLVNSFNIKNLFRELRSPLSRNMDREIKILFGIKALCYIITMLYTCAPIFFKPSASNPEFLTNSVKWFSLQLIYNGDVFFDVIISIEVFISVYPYISPRKELNAKEILYDIIGKIIESYFCMLVIYFVFWKVVPIKDPYSNLFLTYEKESCQAQMIPILGLFSNFTFGLYESYYPYCVYHFWFIHLSIQYFIITLVFVVLYKLKQSLFYLIFFLISLYIFFLQLWNRSSNFSTKSFYDVLRLNPSTIQMVTSKKLFTRIMPLLIGVFVAILYRKKENNCIGSIQKSLCKTISLGLLGIYLFTFWFLVHYFSINDYYKPLFENPIFMFIYSLFKRTMISISFFLLFIPLVSSHKIFTNISLCFNNKIMEFIEKISVGMYLSGSFIARLLFYYTTPFSSPDFSICTLRLLISLIGIIILSALSSVVLTMLFKIPFVQIWLILKRKFI